jgi:hypothetical protein
VVDLFVIDGLHFGVVTSGGAVVYARLFFVVGIHSDSLSRAGSVRSLDEADNGTQPFFFFFEARHSALKLELRLSKENKTSPIHDKHISKKK